MQVLRCRHAPSVDSILAALLHQVESTGSALGSPNVDIPSMLELLHLPSSYIGSSVPIGRSLDDYIGSADPWRHRLVQRCGGPGSRSFL